MNEFPHATKIVKAIKDLAHYVSHRELSKSLGNTEKASHYDDQVSKTEQLLVELLTTHE